MFCITKSYCVTKKLWTIAIIRERCPEFSNGSLYTGAFVLHGDKENNVEKRDGKPNVSNLERGFRVGNGSADGGNE